MNYNFLIIPIVVMISGCSAEVDESEYRFAQQTLKKCPGQKIYLKGLIENDGKLSYADKGDFHTRCKQEQSTIAKIRLIKAIEEE